MKRVSCMVSDVAKDVLVEWKNENMFTTLDEALDDLLLDMKKVKNK